MKDERLFKAVIFDLNSQLLILEDGLEKVINGELSLTDKVKNVKYFIDEINKCESTISKFNKMMTANTNEQNNND